MYFSETSLLLILKFLRGFIGITFSISFVAGKQKQSLMLQKQKVPLRRAPQADIAKFPDSQNIDIFTKHYYVSIFVYMCSWHLET